MTNKKNLIKQIIYRSTHRGTKEMDILLGSFIKKNVDKLTDDELKEFSKLLTLDDSSLLKWYMKKDNGGTVPTTKVSKKLKKFKI